MEVHARQTGVNKSRVGGRRGSVKGFSAASRKRCLRLMACIDRYLLKWLPIFMTLTYHHNIPADPKEWKLQLASFCKRLERRWPDASIVWKLEPQRRGAPHFHLLVFGVETIPHEWVAQAWNEIVEPGNELHLQAGTQVKRAQSWNGVMSYAAKYIGKEHEGFSEQYGSVGRFWGVRRGDLLPIKIDSVSVTWNEYFKLRRVMRGYIERKRVLGHIKRLKHKVPKPERWAKRFARAGPRPGRGYWGGVSMFVAADVALRLYIHVMGG
jgi:hypothetical protein